MRIGVLIPTGTADDPRDLVAFGQRAERLGFDSLFVNDSLINPRVEALTMLAALAPATEGVTLGTAALLPFLRRPVQTAQALASIDLLSGGRLTVGVGAGFPGRLGRPLYALSELPWANRFARLDETVALWRAIWSGAREFHGEFFRFGDIPAMTKPYGPLIPVWLGGGTPGALERAGRHYDGWIPYPPEPAGYASGLAAIRKASNGRDVTAACFLTVRIGGDEERAVDEYARTIYGMPLAELRTIQALAFGTAEQVGKRIAEYAGAGVEHLVVRLAALDRPGQLDQLERVAALGVRQ